MAKKKRNKNQGNSSTNSHLYKQLLLLKENMKKIQEDKNIYFNHKQNVNEINDYYQSVDIDAEGLDLFYQLHHWLDKTHKNRIPYFISKDLFLYTLVDLYPDGTVKSIYSGEAKDPESLIIQDNEVIHKRYEELQEFFTNVKQNDYDTRKKFKQIEWRFKLNTEHVVPQSWFGAVEPMKGDIHHLFICEPECNIARSNFPYGDFQFYQPEMVDESLKNHCGIAMDERFEPEDGKGVVARAMMYFLVRYPNSIRKSFRGDIDIPLLIRWHNDFPVGLYEMHRNQSIYRIQGNRNPFIDIPDLVEKIIFPIL